MWCLLCFCEKTMNLKEYTKRIFNAMLHDVSHSTAETVENPAFDGQRSQRL